MTGDQFADAAVKALGMGITYAKEDCQMFVEQTARRAGGNIPDYRGSNDMLRNACKKVILLDEAIRTGQLQRGWLLFIVKHDGGEPAIYKDSLGNASHVGIYTGNPEVVHSSQSRGGVVASTLKNAWNMCGPLKGVNYIEPDKQEKAEAVNMTGYINLPADKNVFHRISPSKSSAWFGRINGGEEVEVVSVNNGWARVRWGGHDGYVLAQFIATKPPDAQEKQPETQTPNNAGLQELRAVLMRGIEILNTLEGKN